MSETKTKAPMPIEADAYKNAEGELMTDSGTGNSYKVTAAFFSCTKERSR